MTYDVYGIGNALVDIMVAVDDAMIGQLAHEGHQTLTGHLAKGSMHLVDTTFQGHLLRLLEESDQHTISGGSAVNTMVGLAQFGCRVKYAGKVGNDVMGALFADDLHAAHVAYDVPTGSDDTGTCVILVTPDAQRTMFTHLGVSTALTPDDVREEDIKDSQWVYIEGYLWDAAGPKAASLKAMELAKRHGVKVAYTYSDPFCVARARDDFRRFTKEYVDLVFCNEAEARIFAETDDANAALKVIHECHTAVAMTCGAHGSQVTTNGTIGIIAPTQVDAIDSTGAGDLYAAGMLAGLCQGYDAVTAGTFASSVAAEVVTVRGARLPRDTRRKIAANGA